MFEPFYTQVAGLIKIVEAYTRAYAEGESVYQKKKEDRKWKRRSGRKNRDWRKRRKNWN